MPKILNEAGLRDMIPNRSKQGTSAIQGGWAKAWNYPKASPLSPQAYSLVWKVTVTNFSHVLGGKQTKITVIRISLISSYFLLPFERVAKDQELVLHSRLTVIKGVTCLALPCQQLFPAPWG